MKVKILISSVLAALLLTGCNNEETTSSNIIDTTTQDALSKKIATDTYALSFNSEIANDDYTYNYTAGGGIVATQKIDWTNASAAKSNTIEGDVDEDNLDSGYEDGEYSTVTCNSTNVAVVAKPIPKVICDSEKSLCMVYNITCLKEDITVAVTPYLSTLAMPDSASYAYTNDKNPIDGISADVSVQDASGTRLKASELADAVTVTAKLFYKGDNISDIATKEYTLYQVKGLDNVQSKTINLSNATTKVSTEGYDLEGLYPYIVAEDATFTTKSGIVTLGNNPLGNANILVSDSEGNALATTTTDLSGNYSYKILDAGDISSIQVYSNLLPDVGYSVPQESLSINNIEIDTDELIASFPTYFTFDEQSKIKTFLGKVIYPDSTSYSNSYYINEVLFEIKDYITVVKPSTIYSDDTYTVGFKQVSTELAALTSNAINNFLKGTDVTDDSGTDTNSIEYTIKKDEDVLSITTNYESIDDYENSVTTTSLNITKNADETFTFKFKYNSSDNSYETGTEVISVSWVAENEKLDGEGNQLQNVKDGKATFSENESYTSTSDYEDYTYFSKASESFYEEFYINANSENEFVVSTYKTGDSNSNQNNESTEELKYKASAKFTFAISDDMLNTYTNGDDASILVEALTYKQVSQNETLLEVSNINLDVTKDASKVYINGLDATNWPEDITPPQTEVLE